jgi:hypothetical protein
MKNVFNYLSTHQSRLQAMILWLMAIVNVTTDIFWVFAIPAVIATALADILDELKNKK